MKKIVVLILIVAAFWGCSKRTNPVDPTISRGEMRQGFVQSAALASSIMDEPAGRDVYVYIPPGYVAPESSWSVIDSTGADTTWYTVVTAHDYPVVYLLHGFGGDYTYFNNLFALKDVMDELISNNEIIPMVVVIPDGSSKLGGGFYTNSPEDPALVTSFAGKFEDYIIDDLKAYIKLYFNTDTTAAKSGISGHSMGGYGAYRLAIRHPELFGSVSAMSAQVVFDGLKALLPVVYAENGFPPVDTAGQVDSTLLDSAFYAINPSAGRISAMMFAMAAAFSPHSLTNPDTSLFHRLVRTAGFVGVDLPFDVDTTFNDSLWENYWLPNDPMTMLMTGGDDSLTGKSLYLDCGNADDLGLFLQNRAFKDALTASGLSAVYYEYSGYGNDDGDHTTFISDRLREVMKFHSRAFSAQ